MTLQRDRTIHKVSKESFNAFLTLGISVLVTNAIVPLGVAGIAVGVGSLIASALTKKIADKKEKEIKAKLKKLKIISKYYEPSAIEARVKKIRKNNSIDGITEITNPFDYYKRPRMT